MSGTPEPIDLGGLRRLKPISDRWGFDRGRAIDRRYIDGFIADHSADVRGSVMEVGDDEYARRFGADRVEHLDVLHADDGNPKATLVADLSRADHLPTGAYDCIICTQTLQYIYDIQAAVRTLHRLLAPRGIVLATIPGITRLSPRDRERWGEYWHVTRQSAERLFADAFGAANVRAQAYGNVLVAIAFLAGLAQEDLGPEELDFHDPLYEVVVAVRATKA